VADNCPTAALCCPPNVEISPLTTTVDLQALPTHLHATITGVWDEGDVKDILTRIFDAAHAQTTNKILMDCLGIAGEPSLRQRVDLALHALHLRVTALLTGRPARYATAIVAMPPLAHPRRHGLRILIERNLKVTIVETLDQAYAWLEVPAPSQTPEQTAPSLPA
jgi:hypothetical protein